jgi:hypothetical protein
MNSIFNDSFKSNQSKDRRKSDPGLISVQMMRYHNENIEINEIPFLSKKLQAQTLVTSRACET